MKQRRALGADVDSAAPGRNEGMFKIKSAIIGTALVLCGGASVASAQTKQRHITGDFVIGGESCGEMKWYWPDKKSGAGFSWEIVGCDALDALVGETPAATPGPTPQPTPTPVIEQGECPSGAQWLNQNLNNSEIVFGISSVIFNPNETKVFCIRLPTDKGNASRFSLGARGLYNDHGCESISLEASVPAASTVDSKFITDQISRAPDVNIAGGYAWEDPNLAPPGIYVLTATEKMGDRASGEKVCRNYKILALLQY